MIEMSYPRSRLKSAGQCSQCRLHPGTMMDGGRITLNGSREVELLLWTCDKCGYTMLFDLAIPRSHPWHESGPSAVTETPLD